MPIIISNFYNDIHMEWLTKSDIHESTYKQIPFHSLLPSISAWEVGGHHILFIAEMKKWIFSSPDVSSQIIIEWKSNEGIKREVSTVR